MIERIAALLEEIINELRPEAPKRPGWILPEFSQLNAGKQLMAMPADIWRQMMLLAVERILPLENEIIEIRATEDSNIPMGCSTTGQTQWYERQYLVMMVQGLFRRQLALKAKELALLLKWVANCQLVFNKDFLPIETVLKATRSYADGKALSKEHVSLLKRIRERLEPQREHMKYKPLLAIAIELLDGPDPLILEAGEAWSDKAIDDLKSMEDCERQGWLKLLALCRRAKTAEPNPKWLKNAEQVIDELQPAQIQAVVLPWLELVDKPRNNEIVDFDPFNGDPNLKIIESHQVILRGLVWLLSLNHNDEVSEGLGRLAQSSFQHLPGLGARVLKVGNACLYGLGVMKTPQSIAQLNTLKAQVSNRTVLKNIEKALAG